MVLEGAVSGSRQGGVAGVPKRCDLHGATPALNLSNRYN